MESAFIDHRDFASRTLHMKSLRLRVGHPLFRRYSLPKRENLRGLLFVALEKSADSPLGDCRSSRPFAQKQTLT